MSLEAGLKVGDRIFCRVDENWGVVRAILIDPVGRTFERIVIEPPHMVAVGQFAPADRISFSDGALTFDGSLVSFDLNNRAETLEWSNPQNRNVGSISGSVVAVKGLMTFDGTTEAYDSEDDYIGNVVGITLRAEGAVDRLIIRSVGRLRDKDVLVDMNEEIAELGAAVQLKVTGAQVRDRPRA